MLLPFVENAFRHISHYHNGRKNEIRIGLSRQNGEMQFAIDNTTEGKQPEIQQQGGIGLNNVKRRLELLYPRKHRLLISENDGWYRVGLQLKIDENGTN